MGQTVAELGLEHIPARRERAASESQQWRPEMRILDASPFHFLVVSLERSRPLGEERWVGTMAKQMGMEHTLRPTGRSQRDRRRHENGGRHPFDCVVCLNSP